MWLGKSIQFRQVVRRITRHRSAIVCPVLVVGFSFSFFIMDQLSGGERPNVGHQAPPQAVACMPLLDGFVYGVRHSLACLTKSMPTNQGTMWMIKGGPTKGAANSPKTTHVQPTHPASKPVLSNAPPYATSAR